MNEIQIFNNPQFGDIRTAGTPDEPLFCLVDLCRILDLNPSKVTQRLTGDVLSKYPLETAGGVQMVNFVTEDGMYDVILDSRKPEAKAFRRWIIKDVLPTIRKHGIYATPATIENILSNPDFGIQLLTSLKLEREQRQLAEQKIAKIEQIVLEQKPKVEFADAITGSDSVISVGHLAKLLHQNGFTDVRPMGLFEWMRRNGLLCRVGDDHNVPTEKARLKEWLTVKENKFEVGDSVRYKPTPKVTPKGIKAILEIFKSGKANYQPELYKIKRNRKK